MAWVRKAPSGRWRAEWREASGRKRSKTFRRQADATRFLTTLEADQLRGAYIDPSAGKITLEKWWDVFLAREERRLRPATLARYRMHWRLHIAPRLGSRTLSSLTRADVEAFIDALLREDVGTQTIRSVHQLLHRALEVAVRDDRLGRNPARGTTLPRPHKRLERALTAEEVFELSTNVEKRWRAPVLLMGFCGLRIGEVAGLKSTSVDFLRRRILVTEQLAEVGGKLIPSPPKNRRRRAVPVPAFVLEQLAEHMRAFPPMGNGLVFFGRDGAPIRRNHFRRRVFVPAARATGLLPLTPHDLRHTAITLAINAGGSLMAVQAIAGHSSAAVTAEVYAHLLPSIVDEVGARMDAMYDPQAANRRQEAAESNGNDRNGVARVITLSREDTDTRR